MSVFRFGTRRRAAGRDSQERRRSILLWGKAESGKSGFIGALRNEGTKTVGDRWAIGVDDASPDVIGYADSSSLALRLRGVKETPIRRPERAFTAPVRRYAGRHVVQAVDLTVLDPRGELAAEPASVAARRTISAAKTADGILWFLETPPTGTTVSVPERLELLRQLVAMLDGASATGLSIPVVVALTKIDRLPHAEMNRMIDDPEAALRFALGDAGFGWLLAAFPHLRCIALSSAGTVRNAVRPIGLTSMIDWFAEEWRREEHQARAAKTRARRSAQVARVRRRAPIAATITAAAAIVAFAGVAAARLLAQRGATWTSSSGSVVAQGTPKAAPDSGSPPPPPAPSLTSAAAAYQGGDAIGALRILGALRVSDTSAERSTADSLLGLAAMRGTEDALRAPAQSAGVLELIVATTSIAIARAHPGTPVLAPLSLARAGACIGGRLNCPAEQVREDLAWALLLGSMTEQDEARHLRAALLDDSVTSVR